MANATLNNGTRFYISDEPYADGYVNVMVSIPETAYDTVWTMADWFKVGSVLTMPVRNGRFAAKFTDVDGYTIDSLINHLNHWHN